jgi:hypothetical protein
MDGRLLYNPLAALGKWKGFMGAILVVVLLTAVAWWSGVHLDGALDLHVTTERPSASMVVLESLIDWIALGLFLFAAAKLFGGNGGLGAHLAASGLSRFPYILAVILASPPLLGSVILHAVSVRQDEIVVRPQDLITPGMVIGGLVMVALVFWSVTILYLGYKQASRIQGSKAILAFVIGLFAAEAVSKLLVAQLFRLGI